MSDPLYPSPSGGVFNQFIGQPLTALPTPCAVLHLPTIRRNCELLVNASKELGIDFRPHVKTHKTTELTRLQLAGLPHGRVIVSTLREAEALEPLVAEGVVTDILYGIPLPPSSLPRLSCLRSRNPNLIVSVLLDHPEQLSALESHGEKDWVAYIKLDNGYHRAGINPSSAALQQLLQKVKKSTEKGVLNLHGFYSHAGHSYASSTPEAAAEFLVQELETVIAGATALGGAAGGLTLSVGATPTALAAMTRYAGVQRMMQRASESGCRVELHAGVYTTLDLQQVSTNAAKLGLEEIGFTVLAEVVSVYPGRGKDGGDEVLIALGSTGIGREPANGERFPGWGWVSNWGAITPGREDGEASGWVLGRVSQEHGILVRNDPGAGELEVGKKVRLWPQHACIAGIQHGWYFVTEDGETVEDVWVRWRGW